MTHRKPKGNKGANINVKKRIGKLYLQPSGNNRIKTYYSMISSYPFM